jgi:hypothetical protein
LVILHCELVNLGRQLIEWEQLALVYLLNIFYAQSFWASGLGYEEIYLGCILPHGHIILPGAI